MTKEEAIDVLKHNYPSSCYEDLCKAVDMAIEALTNTPNTLNALDTIYRQAAIDALYHVDEHNGRSVEAIRNLPSAQPELGKNSPSEQHKMDKLGVKTEETCTDIISRQAAIDAILECCTSDFDNEYECGYDDGLRQGVHRLKHLPSAQPVIRCKDCKHFGGGTYCHERDGLWDENDFCSYAERRGEEIEDE